MSKVKIFRASKDPLNPEDRLKYNEDFKAMYDRCEEKSMAIFLKERGTLAKRYDISRMMVLQRLVQYGEFLLTKKHNFSIEVEFPSTQKAWKALTDKYEAPIMVAQRVDGKGLVLVIQDMP